MELNIKPYLKADDLVEGAVIEILDEGKYEDREFVDGIKSVFEITVLYRGIKYLYSMNETTQLAMLRDFGSDTRSWIGKHCRVSLVQQNVFGKVKQVIYCTPIIEDFASEKQ